MILFQLETNHSFTKNFKPAFPGRRLPGDHEINRKEEGRFAIQFADA